MSLIRDAEIEKDLRVLIDPVLDNAGIDKNVLTLYIVQDPSLNAFVAGGQNLFLNTGLLIRSENYRQVMGVVAHESGHITGGHLARRDEVVQAAGRESLLLQILAAAAMALGQPQAGLAVLGGGLENLQNSVLGYSRTQERSADQAGLKVLSALGVSPQGLLEFFAILQQEQKILLDKSNAYLSTHPLTEDRIEAIKNFMRDHPAPDSAPREAAFAEAHARMRAKLTGFLMPPAFVLRIYPPSDKSTAARYARAIMDYRSGKTKQAVDQLGQLIAENPDDAYFYEMRGQVIREEPALDPTGNAAIADYEKALLLAPDRALIRLGLAQALIESDKPANIQKSLPYLDEVLRLEPNYGLAWQMESIAEGKAGNIGKSALALAEQALIQGDKKRARAQAVRAIALLKNDSPSRQRAEDIRNQIKVEEKE